MNQSRLLTYRPRNRWSNGAIRSVEVVSSIGSIRTSTHASLLPKVRGKDGALTDRALLLQAIVTVTRKMWDAAARIEHDQERIYCAELTTLLTEYRTKFGDGT